MSRHPLQNNGFHSEHRITDTALDLCDYICRTPKSASSILPSIKITIWL